MSDVTISENESGKLCSDDVVIPNSKDHVTFTTSSPCKVCIGDPSVFGTSSFDIVVEGEEVKFKIQNRVEMTWFTPIPLDAECIPIPKKKERPFGSSPGSHTITMGGGG